MKSLTAMQRRILWLLAHDDMGVAAFPGGEGSRRFGYQPAAAGGLIIWAYQSPEFFLKGRGMLERTDRNAPGHWWRLTEAGKLAASRIRAMPRSPDYRRRAHS